MKISFDGATNTVTGSKHILTTPGNKRILLDCGLFQGKGIDSDERNRVFNFDPKSIDVVLLSHAHIDHSGNIPLLVKKGFSGKIYCTPATYVVSEILLRDSAHIHENDVVYVNKKRAKKNLPLIEPLYTEEDVEKCLVLFETCKYDEWQQIYHDTKFMFSDAGHILGSAAVNIVCDDNGHEKSVCYTGDVGRPNNLLITPPAVFPAPDYLITESTYGDKVHEIDESGDHGILGVIKKTCIDQNGIVLIPAFSVGRTQEIIYSLNNFKNNNQLPAGLKVFVDSPLSMRATRIMYEFRHSLNKEVQEVLRTDKDPFGFKNLFYIQSVQESMELNSIKEPCVIISASGMLDAGRIKHHLKNHINDKNSTLLIVGYCVPESLGGRLSAGEKKVKIFGDEYTVKLNVVVLDEYSGHAGQDELINFLQPAKTKKLKHVFLVHGEDEVKMIFKEKLELDGFSNIIIPSQGQEFEL
jgi:metallo-beta-lactamase family protein